MSEGVDDKTQVRRPLPQPTLASAGFWSAGAGGALHVQRCADCGAYTHPPLPRCRSCHGPNVGLAPVSGRAVVAGFTVNHQQWLAGFPPPYVIAVVALEEDPGARLTTNIVNCPVDEARVGMAVRVVFEHVEDVHLPLFEPDPDRAGETLEVPVDTVASVRPPASSVRFEDRAVLTGVGQSRVGRRLLVDPVSLTVEACERAVADAGLTMADIDGLSTYPGRVGSPGMSEGGIWPVAEALQLHPTWINAGGDMPGQVGPVIAAMMAVSSGLCRHVLCFRTVWEASLAAMIRDGTWDAPPSRATGMVEHLSPYGAMSAANWIGVFASNYFHRYGGDRSMLGWVAVNSRANASRNPEAIYRDPITIDDYHAARMITTPFGLYDCDVPVDGATAIVVSAVETAGDRPHPAIKIEAIGTQITERLSWDQGTLSHEPQTAGPAAHLWTRTDLRHDDVDLALLYDGFTFNAVSWLEALGFCEPGGAADFIDEGRGIALDGRLPLNPHGGQLSAGRLHGFGFIREAMLQLRGEADGRQVADAGVAVVTTGGGAPGGAMLLRRP
ncbi:OB-fold domain-containing protein [Nocardioides sp. cx-173]|uniref:thiolase C-terminal domain-containing protein n=1 Tax=Nocardioides sp. cx-173 TaxID=2898796 RepID=UPI001E625908|nr:OB-fold domain-containing protein [Nocardioides sp. cx-173]MCD4524275.1 OB-fold domain-containing protein [Nocardioides sp. cx-173]UGB41667.1 OB-fold domain-containing protein [Nocardioides sp. cx-173]